MSGLSLRSRGRGFRFGLALALIALPIVLHELYFYATGLPQSVRIASGPEGGRYEVLSAALAEELRGEYGIEVEVIPSEGSLRNLDLLHSGEADLALYQQTAHPPSHAGIPENIRFVANLYSEPTHLMVRRGSGIEVASDLRGTRVNLGPRGSGDYAMSLRVLDHLGLDEQTIQPLYLSPHATAGAFESGELDAAIVTMGMPAPLFEKVCRDHSCDLLELPFRDAFVLDHPFLTPFVIPAGAYGVPPDAVPPEDLATVSSTAQLLTHTDASSRLIDIVTRLVHHERFQLTVQLHEMFRFGVDFSSRRPQFPMHPGATSFYEPELRPLLDPDFVETTEGIRSFLVSFGVAVFFTVRWWLRRRAVRKEHDLDRFVRALLTIERRQMDLDRNNQPDDIEALQDLLDEVTDLRQEALSQFTAHQLNEDHGVDTFIEMCHALSNKMNSKLTRQRLDLSLRELGDTLRGDGAAS